MDARGNIYELTESERAALNEMEAEERAEIGDPEPISAEKVAELREDVARMDGYLRGRAHSDRPKRGPGTNRDLRK